MEQILWIEVLHEAQIWMLEVEVKSYVAGEIKYAVRKVQICFDRFEGGISARVGAIRNLDMGALTTDMTILKEAIQILIKRTMPIAPPPPPPMPS